MHTNFSSASSAPTVVSDSSFLPVGSSGSISLQVIGPDNEPRRSRRIRSSLSSNRLRPSSSRGSALHSGEWSVLSFLNSAWSHPYTYRKKGTVWSQPSSAVLFNDVSVACRHANDERHRSHPTYSRCQFCQK